MTKYIESVSSHYNNRMVSSGKVQQSNNPIIERVSRIKSFGHFVRLFSTRSTQISGIGFYGAKKDWNTA